MSAAAGGPWTTLGGRSEGYPSYKTKQQRGAGEITNYGLCRFALRCKAADDIFGCCIRAEWCVVYRIAKEFGKSLIQWS